MIRFGCLLVALGCIGVLAGCNREAAKPVRNGEAAAGIQDAWLHVPGMTKQLNIY
jgi:hypothetical protein